MSFENSKTLCPQLAAKLRDYITAHYTGESVTDSILPPTSRRLRPQQPDMERFEAVTACRPMAVCSSLEEILQQEDAGFSETLLKLMDKTGKKDSAIYKKANISKQHFSKIRNNPDYRPTKATALAFAIALELDLEATRDLIARAGYALSNSSKFDLIIRYFIEQKIYDIVQINLALYSFDQSLLGG